MSAQGWCCSVVFLIVNKINEKTKKQQSVRVEEPERRTLSPKPSIPAEDMNLKTGSQKHSRGAKHSLGLFLKQLDTFSKHRRIMHVRDYFLQRINAHLMLLVSIYQSSFPEDLRSCNELEICTNSVQTQVQ